MKVEFISLSETGKQSKRWEPFPTSPLLWSILAALTPTEIQVSVQDEHYQPILFPTDADLIAITVTTPIAVRAYQLGAYLDQLGKRVVYGGPHITQIQQYQSWANEPFDFGKAYAIFVGDAEETWPQFVTDFKDGKVTRNVYKGGLYDFRHPVIPRRSILQRKGLQRLFPRIISLEASRGCSGACTFCCANGKYRTKALADIILEMETMCGKYLNFVDSNLGANSGYFDQFLAMMKNSGCFWAGSVWLPALKGRGRAIREAGCRVIYTGVESVVYESAIEARKPYMDISACGEVIDELHSNGVAVIGSFILGFDHDNETVFEKTLQFALRAKLDDASFHIMIPYPGTAIFDKLYKEGRLRYTNYPEDWARYSRNEVVFEPALMTPKQLQEGYEWLIRHFYSPSSIGQRLGNRFLNRQSVGFWLSNLLKWIHTI